ncbi:hypothetical protein F5Y12DRAFT_24814 [Xylaria sp. FL1777]|nr:hypothetical protein F5Y12DRAFT_24814 [Xylaria sp. FL1777]
MMFSSLNRVMSTGALALIMNTGFLKTHLQGCEATVIETSVVGDEPFPEETTTSSINPWPTDTTYTYPSQNECIVATTDAPSGDCLLSVTIPNPEPGFVTNYCGAKNFTTTETRTLTVDCGGCNELAVTVTRGGCPMGGSHPPTHTPQPTPYYHYEWACASTSDPSPPTISACPTEEL